jgi:hypothetical protein
MRANKVTFKGGLTALPFCTTTSTELTSGSLIWFGETYSNGAAMPPNNTCVPPIALEKGGASGVSVAFARLVPEMEIISPRATTGILDERMPVAAFTTLLGLMQGVCA